MYRYSEKIPIPRADLQILENHFMTMERIIPFLSPFCEVLFSRVEGQAICFCGVAQFSVSFGNVCASPVYVVWFKVFNIIPSGSFVCSSPVVQWSTLCFTIQAHRDWVLNCYVHGIFWLGCQGLTEARYCGLHDTSKDFGAPTKLQLSWQIDGQSPWWSCRPIRACSCCWNTSDSVVPSILCGTYAICSMQISGVNLMIICRWAGQNGIIFLAVELIDCFGGRHQMLPV